jgi:formate dehydrogenase subunit gamma
MRAAPASYSDGLAAGIVARFAGVKGGLLPALHEVQATFGFIPRAALKVIAKGFNITEAETYGVVTFYHDFRLDRPHGKHVLKLCRAEACQASGANALAAHVKKKLGVDWGGTTADGEWTLEPVFCLGLCMIGPSAMIDGDVHGALDAAAVDALVQR